MAIFLLPQAVTGAAERFPDSEAVRFSGDSLTYEELALRSNRLARVLVEHGVVRGDRVGIYMNKGLESVVAVYGIMKAGAAYVPLDPFAPVARLGYVVRDCGIRHLVTKEEKRDQLRTMAEMETNLECLVGVAPQDDLRLRCISWDEVETAALGALPDVGTIEQDLAYILYTSGSTGDPKGVMHTHRSGLSFVEWAVDTYALRHEDRLSNHAPLHFDLSTFDLFAGAYVGAATVIVPEVLTKFPANLSKLIQDERLTVWYSVPFALIQLLLRGGLSARDLSSLRWVLFAGEVFPTKHLRALIGQLTHARFSNLYGPTETNVCTYYHVQELPPDSDEPIPIGRPCANVDDLVVDADDRPVAPGEVGELLIRGPVVMRGYWGRPGLTERGFFRRIGHSDYEDTFYRTGDLVQLQPDGNYKYLGRKDRQIKTRGYRVELGEIEVALLSHEQVEEAAVYVVPDGQGSNQIEAAVIATRGASLAPAALEAYLKEQLPSYAIPVKISVTDDFPRTSTGKIDRRALQARASASGSAP
jgi:amino acid adenylation domain-containing protein